MTCAPRIAVILDENTSGDGRRYEAQKGYFEAVRNAGGLPFGIGYLPELIPIVADEFDGLLSTGGRFAFPNDWYLNGEVSQSPKSDRLTIDLPILEAFMAQDKPVLGICAGMQMLACLNGCRLYSDLRSARSDIHQHDEDGLLHSVTVERSSQLHALVGEQAMQVNSFHREAIRELSPAVVASAHAQDGVIEAIEIPSQRFAIGLQWHQERFSDTDHAGNAIFLGFVDACRNNPARPDT